MTPPTSTPGPTGSPTDAPTGGGDPPAPDTSDVSGAGTAEPESFNAAEVSSARRTAGLVLLAALFLGAGAMAMRARRRLVAPVAKSEDLDGPILFWDERLVRATAAGLRRVTRFIQP
jgi:hypothetical protein